MSVVLNPRGVLSRAPAVAAHGRQWIRGVSNPPVLPGHPSRTLFGGCSRPACRRRSERRDRAREVRCQSRLNRRSERCSDRSLIVRSINSRDDRVADAAIADLGPKGNRRGNTGGEHPLRARCSPSLAPDFTLIGVDANALQRPTASANFNQRCELLNARIGRRSVPPAESSAVSEAVNRSTVA